MPALKNDYLMQKRNILNEMRANQMTLQELRFFAIYMSKINKDDESTRVVRFPLADFQAIMELGRINIDYMKKVTDSLLSKIVHVPDPDGRGGYTAFQLFKECKVSCDGTGEWYIEIDAHDKALPMMFDYKNKYFSYRLVNALRICSVNQLRMYELLKQYEYIGSKVYGIEELKDHLWIRKDEYPRYNDFKTWVLDACQQALQENTDIKFTYAPNGKRGKGGKILSLKFYIEKNEHSPKQLSLDAFVAERSLPPAGLGGSEGGGFIETGEKSPYAERVSFLAEACNNEFTREEIIVLWDAMQSALPDDIILDERKSFDYLNGKYHEMAMRNRKRKIQHRFSYLKSMIGKDSWL